MAALNRMGDYLRTLQAFQVQASVTRDEVLTDGQKIQFSSMTDVLAQKPNKLRADVRGDLMDRLYLYDGSAFTVFARRMNYYATVPAPANIIELSDKLIDVYGIELPLIDLFRWGGPKASTADIKAATDIGPSAIQGVTCEQYAFRQPDLDWQIWIQSGSFPLPRKLVLTTLTDPARPEFTAVYTWNLAPSFNDLAFKFNPPPGSNKIVIAELKDAPAGKDK
jgi:hypothetical protein